MADADSHVSQTVSFYDLGTWFYREFVRICNLDYNA